MAESEQVTLHGSWASPYAYRVIWALKLKGIKYEYIEEDISNKSAALLKHNPLHKKVPVLVHNGKAVAESAVILNYIEEAWPDHAPALLPGDPHGRATARFWIFRPAKEEERKEKAAHVLEILRILEDEGLGEKKFFGGDTVGIVDLFYGWLVHWLQPMEQVTGVGVLEPTTLPRLHRWAMDFKQVPVVDENLPDSAALFGHFRRLKERFTVAKTN